MTDNYFLDWFGINPLCNHEPRKPSLDPKLKAISLILPRATDDYFSPYETKFSMQLDLSKNFRRNEAIFLRDGPELLNHFFTLNPCPPKNLRLIIWHQFEQHVPLEWRKRVQLFEVVSVRKRSAAFFAHKSKCVVFGQFFGMKKAEFEFTLRKISQMKSYGLEIINCTLPHWLTPHEQLSSRDRNYGIATQEHLPPRSNETIDDFIGGQDLSDHVFLDVSSRNLVADPFYVHAIHSYKGTVLNLRISENCTNCLKLSPTHAVILSDLTDRIKRVRPFKATFNFPNFSNTTN